MNFIRIEGNISPKVRRARGSIAANQPSENEAATASSLNVSAVSKKKVMESRRKQCYDRVTSKNESWLFFIVGFFIVQNEFLCAQTAHLLGF